MSASRAVLANFIFSGYDARKKKKEKEEVKCEADFGRKTMPLSSCFPPLDRLSEVSIARFSDDITRLTIYTCLIQSYLYC